MDERKRVVIQNYPAEKLPEELRGDIALESRVTVTVSQDDPLRKRRKLQDFVGAGRGLYRSAAHALQELRDARDNV